MKAPFIFAAIALSAAGAGAYVYTNSCCDAVSTPAADSCCAPVESCCGPILPTTTATPEKPQAPKDS